MNFGTLYRSIFRRSANSSQIVGWAFTVQAHLDLKRRIVYVYVADEQRAEAIALSAFEGATIARFQVQQSTFKNLGMKSGQHQAELGSGWSFTIEDTNAAHNPLVFVYLSDQEQAQVVVQNKVKGQILARSVVPPSVIADLGLEPGGMRIV